MAKFNEVQKRRRAATAVRKRKIHGEPGSGKLHQREQPLSMSGKRKQKLLKKWRREQKEALEKGLITMEDVEMAAADAVAAGPSQDDKKPTVKFPMKKKTKLKVKQMKKKGKSKKTKKPMGETSADAMVE